jgi:hypothetical protein
MIKKFGMMAIALGAVLAGAFTVYAPVASNADGLDGPGGTFVCFSASEIACRPALPGEGGPTTSGEVNLMVYSYVNFFDVRWDVTVDNYRWNPTTNQADHVGQSKWSQNYEPYPHADPLSPTAANMYNDLCCGPEPSYSDYFRNVMNKIGL